MTAIMLTRTDASRNMARFYKLDVQPTLFGGWSFIKEWGRLGRAGTVSIELHRTRGRADLALALTWVRKAGRGYRPR
jgi:predicted DNA-binding WGR domain protein